MTFENLVLFERAAQELIPQLSHKLSVTPYGGEAAPDCIAIECENCHEVLIEFLPESGATERPDRDHLKDEAHCDEALDLCYVEAFKPGKSLYPMQERQDIINHSPQALLGALEEAVRLSAHSPFDGLSRR
jgi:hypothetical protein